MGYRGDPVRVLIVPGLHGSGPGHWQTWLQRRWRGSARVEQHDWAVADLERWADRIGETLACHRGGCWVAVAHSFGCLALARYLAREGAAVAPVEAALPVAPADPRKFEVARLLPHSRLPVRSYLVGSETDPWMTEAHAGSLARRWGSRYINLGDAGHINVDAGYGPWPQAHALVRLLVQQVERGRRLQRADPLELSFAV
ncbi:alpha/beta hydrolase [Schlegelella sp. S2-27]|uniref:Alpha/beta hydrolase n=1 Tax=Caldimonas mangrovi TaxID=2944811 RepID=A0ABT0YQS1_9BURK|nr:alpha/beta hydrolase [Caldimonas mangrovi]MCM5680774.1 alpha/beta hydrolase [Caldimonas mangrovi]